MVSKPLIDFLPLKRYGFTRLMFSLVIFIFLFLPRSVWAQENFYQIINGSLDAVDDSFASDRGYSVFVSYDDQKFLFDVGLRKESFLGNLKSAGIALDDVDFVVLSHRHSDHTRGWPFLRKAQASLPIYVPPGGGFSHISESKEVDDHLKITPNIIIIHSHDKKGSLDVTDELSLLIKTKNGPYLFTTNSHTDFFMKVKKVEQFSRQNIYLHSGHIARRISPDEMIETMAKKMKALNIRHISPSHSSPQHDRIFKEICGSSYIPALVGKKVPLELY
ncbi:MAG: MBL fold metallo-hydrolase [Gammaproteobacteria bacterium]|nr:MBL fold metallo-hydrolase [Gammaproteobacteria bacterium]MDH3469401.1 MBL fold metallo-hydrolase [Gammaproteobacteria bacterium]